MPNNNNCEFCDEFSGGRENSFATTYTHCLPDRTILETQHLKVLPSLGQFVKGYLLLIPKVHLLALADATLELLRDIQEVKAQLIRILTTTYGLYTFFEHGVRGSSSGGCGIYHAHLHAVPLSVDRVLSILKNQFPHTSINSLCELRSATFGESYLYCEDPAGQCWVFYPQFLPSQYMRRLMAEEAGISRWDWREAGRESTLLATREEVLNALEATGESGRP